MVVDGISALFKRKDVNNPTVKKIGVVILAMVVCMGGCSILRSGCGGTSGAGPKVLKVSGLYLGMDIKKAHAVLTKRFSTGDVRVGDIEQGTETKSITLVTKTGQMTLIGEMKSMVGHIRADTKGKVVHMGMKGDYLFDIGRMEDSDFVQYFANHYKIPQFNVSDDLLCWYFNSPHGYRVEIREKMIVIFKNKQASFN